MRSGKVAAAFAVLLVVSFAVMNAMPSDTLPATLLQEAVLALVAFAAVGFAIPDALECCTKSVQQRNTVRFTATALLLAGLVGGAITLLAWLFAGGGTMACFASTALPSTADLMENLLLLLGICLLTGLYEESFMRVLGIEAFERALDTKRAILASAALFAARGRARRIGRPAGAFAGGVEVWAGSAVRRDPGCAVCANASVMALRIHPCRLRCFVSGAKRAPNRHDARNICIGGRGRHRAACGVGPYALRYRLENSQRNCVIALACICLNV